MCPLTACCCSVCRKLRSLRSSYCAAFLSDPLSLPCIPQLLLHLHFQHALPPLKLLLQAAGDHELLSPLIHPLAVNLWKLLVGCLHQVGVPPIVCVIACVIADIWHCWNTSPHKCISTDQILNPAAILILLIFLIRSVALQCYTKSWLCLDPLPLKTIFQHHMLAVCSYPASHLRL